MRDAAPPPANITSLSRGTAAATPADRVVGHISPLNRVAIAGRVIDGLVATASVRIVLRVGDHSVAEARTDPAVPNGRRGENFRIDINAKIVRRRLSRLLTQAIASGDAQIYLRCHFTDGTYADVSLLDGPAVREGMLRLGFDSISGRDLLGVDTSATPPLKTPTVDVVCFYLPQFHPIEENDAWWGPGFTEWTNLARMQKQFDAHDAPWLPADLGFYDLRLRDTRQRQAELAKQYGISGFCYYVYWFQGRRLLERPLQLLLEDGEPDIPFCLCWANENWSRRWDGSEAEVLIGQDHSIEADKGFLEDMAPWLADDRYIHVDGKKILLIYRPSLIPERATVFAHWRRRAQELGLGELLICNVMTFGEFEPTALDCDMAIEFPPHTTSATQLRHADIGAPATYEGSAFNYGEVVRSSLGRKYNFDYFPGVMPRWDNTPRKGVKGNVFVNASPELFEIWLRDAFRRAMALPHDRKLVFVNSWNEWAEGAHIEPDSLYGRAFLEVVQRVTSGTSVLANLLRDRHYIDLLSREELERALRQSIFFNDTLGSIIKSSPTGEPVVPARRGMPNEYSGASRLSESVLVIETLNQSSAHHLTVLRGAPLIIRGWSLVSAAFEPTYSRTAILILKDDSGDGGHHLVDQWEARGDVHAYCRSVATNNYFGFECRLSTTTLAAGTYVLELLEFDGHGAYVLSSNRTIEVTE